MSIIYSQWTSQPQQFVPRSGTELMRGAYIWTPHNPRQLVGPRIVQATGETAYNGSPVGDKGVARKWSRSANAGVDFGTTQIITQNSGVTVLVVANPTSAATMKVPFSQRLASGAFTQTDFVFNSSSIDSIGASAGTVVLTTYHNVSAGVKADSQIDGKTHCWVAGNGTANGYIFRDGVKQTLATSTRMSTFTASTQKLRVGNIGDDATTTYPCDDPVYLVVVWDRLLSEAEAKSVSENPWQVFQPVPRRIFVPVSAGSSDTLLYPTKGSLVTSGYVPTITQPGTGTTLSPTKGSLAITGKTPTLTQPNALSPSKAAAIFSGKQPTISQTANQTLSPSKVSLVFSGKTPTIDQTAANSILPGTGHYYTTGKAPTITQPNSLAPSKRAVSLTGYQPTVLQSFSINPTTGAVVITGKTPSITQPNAITPLVAHAILTGKTPIINDSTPMTDSQKLDLIIDILSNKQTLNPTTGIYTLYADDGTTVLMTAQAWEDAAGTIPYRGKALQRLDAMS